MTITKTRSTHYELRAVFFPFISKYSRYKDAREKYRMSVQKTCFVCHKHFNPELAIGLLFTDRGNKLICKPCIRRVAEEGVKVHLRHRRPKP